MVFLTAMAYLSEQIQKDVSSVDVPQNKAKFNFNSGWKNQKFRVYLAQFKSNLRWMNC